MNSSTYYNQKIKNDPEFYSQEKKRVVAYLVKRYNNDEEFREKKKEYARVKMRELNNRRKADKQNKVI